MGRFWGTHPGKLDRKGRIAVPAQLRGELEATGKMELAFRVSHLNPCIEAHSGAAFDRMADYIQSLPFGHPDRSTLEYNFLSNVHIARPDGDGRLILPEHYIAGAGLKESITFLGRGDRFEIWDSEAAKLHAEQEIRRMREKALMVGAMPIHPTPNGVS